MKSYKGGDRVVGCHNQEKRTGIVASVFFGKGNLLLVDVCYQDCSWSAYAIEMVNLISRRQVRRR